MRDFQIRTEDLYGEEGCEVFTSWDSAQTRYQEMLVEASKDEWNALCLIELIEVLEQHEISIGSELNGGN